MDESLLGRMEAIILSMTPYERENPNVLNSSRKRRIAAGSGTQVVDINRLLKQFEMMQAMTKQFAGGKMPKSMRRLMGKRAARACWAARCPASPSDSPTAERSTDHEKVDLFRSDACQLPGHRYLVHPVSPAPSPHCGPSGLSSGGGRLRSPTRWSQ